MTRWLLLALCAACANAAGQAWSPDDLWNLHSLRDPQISPDGRQVVYLDEWNDRASDSVCANLHWLSIADKQTRAVTDGAWLDRSPRWSADGSRIAWISGRGGIHVLSLGSGQEAKIEGAPLTFAWSPDGKWLAFTAPGENRDANPPWAPPNILKWLGPPALPRTALYVVPSTGGEARAITQAGFDATGEPAWMRDSKSVLVTSADGEIYVIRVADSTARRLNQEPGRKTNPLPSPDGSKIAWMTVDALPHSYSVPKMFVMNADGSRIKGLAGALDRDPVAPHWSSDSRTIYFTADDAGSTHVIASRADSTLRQVTKSIERLRGFSLADNGHAVAVRSTDQSLELISFTVDLPSTPVALLSPREKIMAEHSTGATEEVQFTSAGRAIQGWLVKPPQFDSARKYPLLLDIADTPRRMYSAEFSLRAQIFAARGWLVLRINPRGTPGYGEQFGRLLPTRYPGDDADDLLAAVDSMAGKSFVDAKRIAVSGGLLAAWMVGHTDRFAAAVISHPIVDFALYALSSPENGKRALSWMGAMPWDDSDQYQRHSPISFVQHWKTPTLVIAHGNDAQADELMGALQGRKIDSSMVHLPDDKLSSRILEWESSLAWLSR